VDHNRSAFEMNREILAPVARPTFRRARTVHSPAPPPSHDDRPAHHALERERAQHTMKLLPPSIRFLPF